MKQLLSAVLLTFLSTITHASHDENCWDSSFAYRVVSVSHGDGQIEVGFAASFNLYTKLGLPADRITDMNGISVDEPRSNTKLFLSFDDSECQTKTNGDLICDVDVAADKQFNSKRVFVRRSLDHLGHEQPIITEVPVSEFGVEITRDTAAAFIKYGSEKIAMIGFEKRFCNLEGKAGGTYFGDAFFPAELSEYVKR